MKKMVYNLQRTLWSKKYTILYKYLWIKNFTHTKNQEIISLHRWMNYLSVYDEAEQKKNSLKYKKYILKWIKCIPKLNKKTENGQIGKF